MSELNEPRWAVISERGIETSNVTYSQALELEQTLGEQGIHGRCVVTTEAAHRTTTKPAEPPKSDPATTSERILEDV
jgi:hypothetical protein